MKKFLLTIALAAVAAVAANAQTSVGVGYVEKNAKSTHTTTNIGGLYVHADHNIALAGDICVAPGVAFAYVTNSDLDVKGTYIDVPIHFNYAFPVAEGFNLGIFAGPTVSLGLTSKTGDSNDFDHGLKRFDILVGGGVALDIMDIIRVSVGYNAGLLNRSEEDAFKLNTNGLHFGAAYLF